MIRALISARRERELIVAQIAREYRLHKRLEMKSLKSLYDFVEVHRLTARFIERWAHGNMAFDEKKILNRLCEAVWKEFT